MSIFKSSLPVRILTMKTNNLIWPLLVAFGLLTALSGCTESISSGGEIGNPITITGKVVDKNNRGMSSMKIYLLNTETFNPIAALLDKSGKTYEATHPSAETTTDSNGVYSFTATIKQAEYHIFGQSTDTALMVHHIIWVSDTVKKMAVMDTAVAPGAVVVGIIDSIFAPDGYVFVKGSLLFVKIDSVGRKTVRCPAGLVSLMYYSAAADSTLLTIPSSDTNSQLIVKESTVVDLSSQMHRISKPQRPTGDTIVYLSSQGNGVQYSTGMAVSNLGDTIAYRITGDTTNSPWTVVVSGTMMTYSIQWSSAGTYTVLAQARSINDTTIRSAFSEPLTVTVKQ
jgi:hypothetical protein